MDAKQNESVASSSTTPFDRSLLLFYAASPNSCTRAHIDASFDGYNASDVLVTRTVPRHLYAEYLYDAKYCFVPDGFSSISARLYEVDCAASGR